MIRLAHFNDLEQIDALAVKAIKAMHQSNIFQWTLDYPRKQHFLLDIQAGECFVYTLSDLIIGVMVITKKKETAYEDILWLNDDSTTVHRLIVDPAHQNKQIASAFINYAKQLTRDFGLSSIKIDTHPNNYKMRHFLKRNHFTELDYLKSIHRIAYQLLIAPKIQRVTVLGNSGTGKTTLAKKISHKLNYPHLSLDSVYWQPNWKTASSQQFNDAVLSFLKSNTCFVIDGNYMNSLSFEARLKFSDTIIILDYPNSKAIKGIFERETQYKHRHRSDMAKGCIENVDQEFLHYVYHFGAKNKKIKAIALKYARLKNIYIFKNRVQLNAWLESI